jgi:hypothetical protein
MNDDVLLFIVDIDAPSSYFFFHWDWNSAYLLGLSNQQSPRIRDAYILKVRVR